MSILADAVEERLRLRLNVHLALGSTTRMRRVSCAAVGTSNATVTGCMWLEAPYSMVGLRSKLHAETVALGCSAVHVRPADAAFHWTALTVAEMLDGGATAFDITSVFV